MSMPPQSRRDFLASITAAGAVSLVAPRGVDARTVRRSFGANDRIRIGVIGCGNRGIDTEMASVRDHAKEENLEVIAVYDPWRVARENAAAKAKEWFGTDAKQCRSVDELLGLAEVDAVFISSPDHWHASHLEAATKARKHVYVEKPMAIEIGELNRAYAAAKASGVVIQVGTQLRSTPIAMGCRELVKSGKLGRTLPHRASTQRRQAVLVRVPQARRPPRGSRLEHVHEGSHEEGLRPDPVFGRGMATGSSRRARCPNGPCTSLTWRTLLPASVSRRPACAWAASTPGRTNTTSPRRTRCRLSGAIPRA